MARITRKYFVVLWLGLLSVLFSFTAWNQASSQSGTARTMTLDELTVQRINIIEPDGKPRLIMSSKARFPGLYMRGTEYRHPNRSTGGMLFYNSEGDEVGGLIFDAQTTAEGYSASSAFNLDQYRQDQTVGISYAGVNGRNAAGLQVWDRGNWDILEYVKLGDRLARATSEEERQKILAEIQQFESTHFLGATRLYAGKLDTGDALVHLADTQGRPRLIIKVDGQGTPSIEFLNESGQVIARLPQ